MLGFPFLVSAIAFIRLFSSSMTRLWNASLFTPASGICAAPIVAFVEESKSLSAKLEYYLFVIVHHSSSDLSHDDDDAACCPSHTKVKTN